MANQALWKHALIALNVLLKCSPALILHHHVNSLVGAEEVEHSNDVGMAYGGQ